MLFSFFANIEYNTEISFEKLEKGLTFERLSPEVTGSGVKYASLRIFEREETGVSSVYWHFKLTYHETQVSATNANDSSSIRKRSLHVMPL